MRWIVRENDSVNTEYLTQNQNGSALIHYGVKGMKWGIRRTPEELGHKRKGEVKNVGAKPLNYHSLAGEKAKRIAKQVVAETIALMDPTGIFATAYNSKVIYDYAGGADAFQSNEKYMKKDGSVEKLKDIKKKTETGQSMVDDSKFVNSGSKGGRTKNCMCCVTALEMRQRGYDVQARRRVYGYVSDAYKDWFGNVKIESTKVNREPKESRKDFVERGYKNLTDTLEKYPNGSRGFIAFSYEGTKSGHTISWQVKDKEVTFYDAQGKTTSADKVLSFSDQNYEYGRLDNCTLKPAIAETVVSRKDKR